MNHFPMGRDRFVWTRKSGSNNNKMVLTLKDCRCVNKHIKKKYQRAYNSRCHPLRDMEFKLSHFYVLKINAPGIKAYRDFFFIFDIIWYTWSNATGTSIHAKVVGSRAVQCIAALLLSSIINNNMRLRRFF